MFDIGWTELLVVACIAIIVVGPKDLPRMLRTFGQMVGKLRRMANEFQSTFNDALREAEKQADIDEMRKQVEEVGNFDPLGDIKKSIEPIKKAGDDLAKDVNKRIDTGEAPQKVEDKPVEPAVPAEKSGDVAVASKAPVAETPVSEDAPAKPTSATGAKTKATRAKASATSKAPTTSKASATKKPDSRSTTTKSASSTKAATAKSGAAKPAAAKSTKSATAKKTAGTAKAKTTAAKAATPAVGGDKSDAGSTS
ncbi:sec-independent protein translocase protein TatB [Breoghania corrubedonensis]|uniref:Sec-independent protein translocase protein TatB n=1 Tax=Breoghania corrubedonensis TaxID=665038 RepID=A0A2T5V8G1_9HYPH|nr:Sec-independent protein translocase protein TatB [Breoghania corrubedonensis]PTW60043.1 sec-independent protein translocase protein TatB [Breoghania corrubedonensis]